LLLMPIVVTDFSSALQTEHLGLQILRGLFSLGAQLASFMAVLFMPLADAIAFGFSQVIFVTLAAAIFLKERVGWRRWVTTLVGCVGVMIMLR
ncbi:EamA family transporter, partial [Escherichia coli]